MLNKYQEEASVSKLPCDSTLH